jgi:mono/diheme cytochrome c family protein
MMLLRLPLALVVLVALPLSNSVAQGTGDAKAGEALARAVCAQCHKVASDQPRPQRSTAPDFAAIANMSSTTETALHVFLLSPHPSMPNLILSPRRQDDVIAYILTLRRKP